MSHGRAAEDAQSALATPHTPRFTDIHLIQLIVTATTRGTVGQMCNARPRLPKLGSVSRSLTGS